MQPIRLNALRYLVKGCSLHAAAGLFLVFFGGGACNGNEAREGGVKAPSASQPSVISAPHAQEDAGGVVPPGAIPAPSDEEPGPWPVKYPIRENHSPISNWSLAFYKELLARFPEMNEDRFIKVGDSVTASGDNLFCFTKPAALKELELLSPELYQTALYFGAEKGYAGPFGRTSQAAVVGWSARNVIDGERSALVREQQMMKPRFALVQYGTNDMESGGVHHFADKLFDIGELLLERGTLPIFYTVMNRRDKPQASRLVPEYNGAIRGVAEALSVPLVDLNWALDTLPKQGLSGDGIHPSTFKKNGLRSPCDLSEEGLKAGYNMRNRLSLEVLMRVKQAFAALREEDSILNSLPKWSELQAKLASSKPGSAEQPIPIVQFPFVDFREVNKGLGPSGCEAQHPSAHAAIGSSYRLHVKEAGAYQFFGFDRGVQSQLDIYRDGADEADGGCVGSHPQRLALELSPGIYRVELRIKALASAQGAGSASGSRNGASLMVLQR